MGCVRRVKVHAVGLADAYGCCRQYGCGSVSLQFEIVARCTCIWNELDCFVWRGAGRSRGKHIVGLGYIGCYTNRVFFYRPRFSFCGWLEWGASHAIGSSCTVIVIRSWTAALVAVVVHASMRGAILHGAVCVEGHS